MASYAGFGLGHVRSMPTRPAPKARQINEYPGADGLEVIDLGARGGTTHVTALLVASTTAGLVLLKQGLRTLQQAGTGNVLITVDGESFDGVILVDFEPGGAMRPCTGGWCEAYQATFLHVY